MRDARREAFRSDVVNQLRSYSVHIQDTRTAFEWLLEALNGGRLRVIDIPTSVSVLADDDYEVGKLFDQRARKSLSQLSLSDSRKREASELDRQLMAQLHNVEAQADRLDRAWSQVRPLIDDAREETAVTFLRRFRHDLRHRVNWSLSLVEIAASIPRDVDAIARANESICCVLQAADLWNAEILGIRRSIGQSKR
jgi:hypothetical protein